MFTMYQDHGLWWIWFSKSIPSQVTPNIHKTYIRFNETLNYICYMVLEFLTTSGLDRARWKQRVETWEGFPLLLLLPPLVKSSSTLSSVGDRLALSLHLAATLWKHWTWLSHSVKIALGHHTLKILHLARPQNIVLVRNYPCTLHTIYWEVSICHTTLLSYTWWAYYEGLTQRWANNSVFE